MDGRFAHTFRIVAAIHIVALIAMIAASSWPFTRRTRSVTMPVEFVVEVPPAAPVPEAPPVVEPTPPPPEPKPPPRKTPAPKPRKKKQIKVSKRRVARKTDTPPERRMSEEEIRKLLQSGAKPSDHTQVPDVYSRELQKIRDAMDEAWERQFRPSYSEVGGATAVVRIWLRPDGSISKWTLEKASGHSDLDASATGAVQSVKRVMGLSSAFLSSGKARVEGISIDFCIKAEE